MLCKTSRRGCCAQVPRVLPVLYIRYACLGTQGTHLSHVITVPCSSSRSQPAVISGTRSGCSTHWNAAAATAADRPCHHHLQGGGTYIFWTGTFMVQ